MVIERGWAEQNLTSVWVPQLSRRLTIHVKAAQSFLELWAAWERLGLLGGPECPAVKEGRGLVLDFNGTYVPRFKRQSGTYVERVAKCRTLGAQSLSNHAWGTAFDVNARWNPLGKPPVALGATGSVRELEPSAAALGWVWGGVFRTRPDGMHFEFVGLGGRRMPSAWTPPTPTPPAAPATPTPATPPQIPAPKPRATYRRAATARPARS